MLARRRGVPVLNTVAMWWRAGGIALTVVVSLVAVPALVSADSEVEELRKEIRALRKRVEQLEHERGPEAAPEAAPAAPPRQTAGPAPGAPAAPATVAVPKAPPHEVVGTATQVEDRGSMQDQQQAAPRPGTMTLDPKYQGFINIPNTHKIKPP